MGKLEFEQGKTYKIISLGTKDPLYLLEKHFKKREVKVIQVLHEYNDGCIKAEVQFQNSFGFASEVKAIYYFDSRESYVFNCIELGEIR